MPVGLVALVWLVAKFAVPHKHAPQKKAMAFTLLLAFIVLPTVSTKLFRVFVCLSFDDGTRFLAVDLRINCDSTLHTTMRLFSAFFIAVYPIGIPLGFFLVLRANRTRISSRDTSKPCPPELAHIAVLFAAYSQGNMYWEIVESVRRLLLSSALVFMGRSSAARTTWGALLSIFFAVVFGEAQPCLNPTTQGFSFAAQWLVVVHFLLALILAAGFDIFSPSLIGVLLVVSTGLVIVGAFVHRHKRKIRAHEQLQGLRRAAKMITAQPCVMICDPGRTVNSELALVLLRVLRDLGHIEPLAIIANVSPQRDRARLLRKRLDSLGLHDVPVGVGTSGGVIKPDKATSEQLQSLGEDPSFASKSDSVSQQIFPGGQLLETTWDEAAPASLVLLLTSSLKVRPEYFPYSYGSSVTVSRSVKATREPPALSERAPFGNNRSQL